MKLRRIGKFGENESGSPGWRTGDKIKAFNQ
jgi:hypothetical protein